MRKRIIAAALIAALLVSGCSMLGMAGREARQNILSPMVTHAWPPVSADVLRGVNDASSDGELDQLIATDFVTRVGEWDVAVLSDSAAAVVRLYERDWEDFEPLAQRGIADRFEDGEIGPGVAVSRQERLEKFGEVLRVLSGEPTDPE